MDGDGVPPCAPVLEPLDPLKVKEAFVRIVYDSVIQLCGREQQGRNSVTVPQAETAIDVWRAQLATLVERTVTVRTLDSLLTISNHSSQQQQQLERSKLYDVEIRTAPALFQRYHAKVPSNDEFSSAFDATAKSWTMVSDMGVSKSVSSALQLSQLLLPLIQDAAAARTGATHVRVAPHSGFVTVATRPLVQRLTLASCLPCPYCPVWCTSAQSVWWHVQQQHGQRHDVATDCAIPQHERDVQQQALVVYKSNLAVDYSPMPLACTATSSPRSTSRRDNVEPWSLVKRGDLPKLQAYIAATSFDVTSVDTHGAGVLHWAAGQGHLTMVQYLVETCRCDMDAPQDGHRSYRGRTALHWAARNGHAHVVAYLLQQAPLETAHDENEAATWGRHNRSGHGGKPEWQRQRLEATTADGTTAFCWAAWQGHLDVLRLLYETYQCRIDTTNQFGCNAVLWAAQSSGDGTDDKVVRVMQWLESVGASLYTVNHSGHGLLHKAAQRGHFAVCRWFMESRLLETEWSDSGTQHAPLVATSNVVWPLIGPDNDGGTPSDLAGMEQHTALAQYLARLEMAVVQTAYSANSHLPDWLASVSLVPSNNASDNVWEPGAGVHRMQWALAQTRKNMTIGRSV